MLLPTEYGEISNNNQVPEKYRAKGYSWTIYVYLEIMEKQNELAYCKSYSCQAALLAASPAYSEGTNVTWEQAANNMAEVLSALGSNPLAELDPKGNKWYASSTDIQNLPAGVNLRKCYGEEIKSRA